MHTKTTEKKKIEKNLYNDMCDHPVDCRRIGYSRLLWIQSNIFKLECEIGETECSLLLKTKFRCLS